VTPPPSLVGSVIVRLVSITEPGIEPEVIDAPSGWLSDDERRTLQAGCDRALTGHGLRTPADMLRELGTVAPEELAADRYGDGGTVALLENEVRDLLGMPAAVFMPSGTMIQQIALRIHADRRQRTAVAFHPTCHIDLHEDKAYQTLHGLIGRPVGNARELLGLADLEGIREPLAALVIELPQREIGGRLPAWEDLVAQVTWARDQGAAVHLDGARLWECGPFYDRPYAEIAGLFDTAYVSFYKGIGGPAGGMLLGDADVIDEARLWRHRHGGTLFNLWPYAAADLAGFRLRLPRMGAYVEHARAIANALSAIEGVEVVPNPPQTPMMQVYLRTTPDAVISGIRRMAAEERLWTFGGSQPADVPGFRWLEVSVGDATLAATPDEVVAAVRQLLPA
jgi:threonine aldolase